MNRTRRRAVLWIAFLLLALPTLFLWMLLGTGMGVRYALKQLGNALPDGRVEYASVEGSLWGGARIVALRIASAGSEVEIAELRIETDLGGLLRGLVRVERLAVRDVTVRLPADDGTARSGSDAFPLAPPSLDLPVAIELVEARIDGAGIMTGDEPVLELEAIRLHGSLAGGLISVGNLTMRGAAGEVDVGGSIDTGRHWRSTLTVAIVPTQAEHAFSLDLVGDLRQLTLHSAGAPAWPLDLRIEARDLHRAQPRWQLVLRADDLEPSRLWPDWTHGPLGLDLHAHGDRAHALLAGEVRILGRTLEVESLEARREVAGIALPQLRIREGEQMLAGEGSLAFGAQIAGDVDLRFERIVLPVEGRTAEATGQFTAAGDIDDWRIDLEATIVVDDQTSEVILAGRGDRNGFDVERLAAGHALGRLLAEGRIDWLPSPAWRLEATLQRFEPQRLGLPVEARLDADLSSEGRWNDAQGPSGRLLVERLAGTLSGSTVTGRADVAVESASRGRLDLALRLGDGGVDARGSLVDGRLQGTIDLERFDPAPLGVPLHMRGDGTIRFQGALEAPAIELDLQTSALRHDAVTVGQTRVSGRIAADRSVDLDIRAQDLELGTVRLREVEAGVDGTLDDHRIDLRARGAPGEIALAAAGSGGAEGWQGRVESLVAEIANAGRWQLREAVALEVSEDASRLSRACLDGERGSLCLQADLPTDGDAELTLDSEGLSLALLSPFLFPDGLRRIDGTVEGQALARRVDRTWRAEADFRLPALNLFLDPSADEENFLQLLDVSIEARHDGDGAQAALDARIGGDGRLDGTFALGGADGTDAIAGAMRFDFDAAGLETLLVGIEGVQGRIDGELRLEGRLDAPRPTLRASLRGFGADVTAAGIRLREGSADARSDGETIEIEASVASGEGRLHADGTMRIAERALTLRIRGEAFEAADLPQVRLDISPDLSLEHRDGAMRLAGSVAVPSALVDISRFEGADRPSADVVILEDGVEPAADPGLPVTARVTVTLGEDVRLRGFGLDGRLTGALTVRETPGQATRGQGTIEASGSFAAYGRQLDIQRGRLLFNGALDNPVLDVRAERAIDEVTVGVQATGEAVAPQLGLYSRPLMSQSDILAYLVVGRPMSQVRGGEGELLTDAATTLGTAGGDLLARQLGARMGLDLGVEASDELGTALTVGKFLSPRLYLGYGVSLFGTGQAVLLRYLFSERWSAEVESGSESKASLNYRLER